MLVQLLQGLLLNILFDNFMVLFDVFTVECFKDAPGFDLGEGVQVFLRRTGRGVEVLSYLDYFWLLLFAFDYKVLFTELLSH